MSGYTAAFATREPAVPGAIEQDRAGFGNACAQAFNRALSVDSKPLKNATDSGVAVMV